MNSLSLKNVSIYYGNKKGDETCAVDDFSFTFKGGKKYAIIGYSGCGKTSLVKAIAGALLFDGDIFLDDKRIENIPVQERNISFVNQQFFLYPHMTIYDNIVFPLRNTKIDHEEADIKVKKMAIDLDIFYLLTRKPKAISIGQASRVAIARALIKKSDIYIFDEPLANLDMQTGQKVEYLIKKITNEYKSSVIFITHDVKEAFIIADYILVMYEGKLVGEFTPQSIFDSDNNIVKSLLKDVKKDEKD